MRVVFLAAILAAVCALGAPFQPELSVRDVLPIVGAAGSSTSVPEVNASLALRASFFNKILQDALPIVDMLDLKIAVDGESSTHYKFDKFNLTNITVQNITAEFQEPSTLYITGTGISFVIPNVDFELMEAFLHCKGTFYGATQATDLELSAVLDVNSKGQLQINSVSPSVQFGTMVVNHTLQGSLCNDLDHIIDKLLGSVNKIIKDVIVKLLPSKISKKVKSKGNSILEKVPVAFVTQPEVQEDTLALTANILSDVGAGQQVVVPSTLPLSSPSMAQFHFINRDFAIGFDSKSLDDLVAFAAARGLFAFNKTVTHYNTSVFKTLLPEIYDACPNCPFQVDVSVPATRPPTVLFANDSMTFSFVNVFAGLNVANISSGKKGDHFTPLVDFHLNLTFSLDNFNVVSKGVYSNVTFKLALEDFGVGIADLPFPGLKPIHLKTVSSLVEDLIKAFLIPEFNAKFKGIPIAVEKDGFGLENWVVRIGNKEKSITIGGDLKLPKL